MSELDSLFTQINISKDKLNAYLSSEIPPISDAKIYLELVRE